MEFKKEELKHQLKEYLGIHNAECMFHGYVKHTRYGCADCIFDEYKLKELSIDEAIDKLRLLGLVADKAGDTSLVGGIKVLSESPIKIYDQCFTIEKLDEFCWVGEFTGMQFGVSVLTGGWLFCIINILEDLIKIKRSRIDNKDNK